MVSTVGVKQSKKPCHRCHLPFPFHAKLNVMNGFGWARGSDCRIVRFGVLALARGGCASHFLVKTPAKIRGRNALEEPWGRIGS
jgi:hypothetical protein